MGSEMCIRDRPRSQGSAVLEAINLLSGLSGTSSDNANSDLQSQGFSELDVGEENALLESMLRKNMVTFRTLLDDESATVSSVTAYLLGCAKLSELSDDIWRQLSRPKSDSLECFYAALKMLGIDDDHAIEQAVTV